MLSHTHAHTSPRPLRVCDTPPPPANQADDELTRARRVVDLPMLLVGETARLLVMTDHGTHLVDVEAVAVTPRTRCPDEPGGTADEAAPEVTWEWTLALRGGERSTFALVQPAAELTPTTGCEGCGAEPDEPCRWGCLSHETTDQLDDPTDPTDPADQGNR